MREKMRGMDADAMACTTINMNSFSDASSVQLILEQPLEKQSGRGFWFVLHQQSSMMTDCSTMLLPGVRYGPPGSRRLVYFVDDMNMPSVDKYSTQSAIELMRQSIDYRGWFDKVVLVLQRLCCMPPPCS
jgi:dynein heavy chain